LKRGTDLKSKEPEKPRDARSQAALVYEHLTIFADLLGFEEAIGTADDSLRLSILKLLTDLAALRADFFISSTPIETVGYST
jgi:hypothetical protein